MEAYLVVGVRSFPPHWDLDLKAFLCSPSSSQIGKMDSHLSLKSSELMRREVVDILSEL